MVSGAVSSRQTSKGNANRGWVKLVLVPKHVAGLPALSPAGLAATAGLLLRTAGYAMRRRLFA